MRDILTPKPHHIWDYESSTQNKTTIPLIKPYIRKSLYCYMELRNKLPQLRNISGIQLNRLKIKPVIISDVCTTIRNKTAHLPYMVNKNKIARITNINGGELDMKTRFLQSVGRINPSNLIKKERLK